jgi:UDP-2,4-diacetamido-2,4,6-trideoxy-beta-L-altropyranose hydrolase
MNIAIRADGSPFIGMGHVMRCLSLAAALRQSGHNVEFFSRFEPGLSRIREQGFAVRQVAGGLPDGAEKEYEPAQDTDAVCQLLADSNYNGLVTDSYRLDADYFRQVRRLVKTSVYIDDLNRFPAAVDAVINGNINAEELGYDAWPDSVQRWLGCRYNLLRPEFAALTQRETPYAVDNILIVLGGGDAGELLVFLAESLLKSAQARQFKLQLVAPAKSLADDRLTKLAQNYPAQVQIQREVTAMAQLMQRCDMAISAGGSTLYELCAAGVPRLAVVLASNQQRIVDAMVRQGAALSLGTVAELTSSAVAVAVDRLAQDWQVRDRMAQLGRQLVDGQGAFRLAGKIEEMLAKAGRSTIK